MIETPRLRLRPWRDEDKPAFEAIINTPAMMEHFGGVAPAEQIGGLKRRAEFDFRHPKFAPGDPLGVMVVYVIDRPA